MHDLTGSGDRRARWEELAGKRRDVWLIAAIVVALLLGALVFKAIRLRPQIAPPASATHSVPTATASGAAILYVHVSGAVRKPGLYEFLPGARVADAVETAGGAKPGADLSALNLAELLTDGMQVDVPARGNGSAAPVATASGASPATVNLNTADQIALETIPGVGPVTALAILQTRDRLGSFTTFEQLLEVDGIGPATLEAMRPYVSI
ncbi:MAG TPA: ComEA family DNA-binding protein [Actinomycetota bacterium]|nr:ComEA family DNA-binding protein [Actinomycetota bacterium]